MKRNYFLLLAAICISIAAAARVSKPLPVTKKLAIEGSFKKISITGRVKIILVNNVIDSFTLHGEQSNISNIKMDIRNGKLRIKAPHKSFAEKSVIYVPISMLHTIDIDGDADIYSDVILTAPMLSINVSGAAHARLKTTGEVEVNTGDDYEILYSTKKTILKQ